ncbi:MAG: phage tail assembly protein, partial [Shimia sp.]
RSPKAGELRGVKLAELLQMDVGTVITVLPRVTQPPLNEAQAADLPFADLAALSARLVGFLATSPSVTDAIPKTGT